MWSYMVSLFDEFKLEGQQRNLPSDTNLDYFVIGGETYVCWFITLKDRIVSLLIATIEPDTLYVDLGCTYQSEKYRAQAAGANYLIRVYVSAQLLLEYDLRYIRGQAVGSIGGSQELLFKYHEDRGCIVFSDAMYTCKITDYLNRFTQFHLG